MKRKIWLRLLSLAVALLLPAGALAQSAALDLLEQAKTDGKEIVTTLTFEPGATLAADTAVADMSAVTAIRVSKLPGGYTGLAISLQGNDVLTAKLKAGPDGLYVLSEVLGEKPLYFSWADASTYIADAMKNGGMDQASIDRFKQGFEQAIAAGAMNETVATDTPPTEEEIKQQIITAMGGDDSLIQWVNGLEAKKVVTQGSFTLGDSDTADTKTELLITKDDLLALFDLPYIQHQITTQLKQEDATLTDEQLTDKTKDAVDQAKASITKSDVSIPITYYTQGTETLVGLDATMTGNFEQSEPDTAYTDSVATAAPEATATADAATAAPAEVKTAKITMNVQMTSKTLDTGKLTTVKMNASKDEKLAFDLVATLTANDQTAAGNLTVKNDKAETVLLMNLNADYTDPKNVSGKLETTVSDPQNQNAFVIGFNQQVGEATVDTALSLSSGTSVEAITANPDAALLGKLKLNTVAQADSGFYASLKEATPASAVELLKLSAADMDTFAKSVKANAMKLMFTMMDNLPSSVSTVLINSMMGQ